MEVEPSWQRRGIGTWLVQHALAWLSAWPSAIGSCCPWRPRRRLLAPIASISAWGGVSWRASSGAGVSKPRASAAARFGCCRCELRQRSSKRPHIVRYETRLCCTANLTRLGRSETPSFSMMRRWYVLTVVLARKSCSVISLFVFPCTSRWKISYSRSLRLSSGLSRRLCCAGGGLRQVGAELLGVLAGAARAYRTLPAAHQAPRELAEACRPAEAAIVGPGSAAASSSVRFWSICWSDVCSLLPCSSWLSRKCRVSWRSCSLAGAPPQRALLSACSRVRRATSASRAAVRSITRCSSCSLDC